MKSSKSIAVTPTMSPFFEEVLGEAMRTRRCEATQAATHYLVSLLCDFARPNEESEAAFREPLAFVLRDALQATGAERFRRLRLLGDAVLYVSGFFGSHIQGRGIDSAYVADIGSAAYRNAAAMLRINTSQASFPGHVLSELALKFQSFSRVLADIAESLLLSSLRGRDQQSLVQLYERWLHTGSSRLAGELAAQGFLIQRSPQGMKPN